MNYNIKLLIFLLKPLLDNLFSLFKPNVDVSAILKKY